MGVSIMSMLILLFIIINNSNNINTYARYHSSCMYESFISHNNFTD